MALGFAIGSVSGIPVIAFEGDLDGVSCDEFEAAVLETARDADNCVIIDLTGVSYIDSQSFGRLLRAHVFLEEEGGDLAIVAGDTNLARTIRTFGADYLLSVLEDQEAAADCLRPLIRAQEP